MYMQFAIVSATVRQAREDLGWVSTSPYHCRFIGEANKEKQLKWSNEMRDTKKTFLDVISTDNSSVESSQHSLKQYKRKGNPKKMKPHPLKVHVSGGIFSYGASPLTNFTNRIIPCCTSGMRKSDVIIY